MSQALFDYSRMQMLSRRASRIAAPDRHFLHEIAAEEIAGRLLAVNRRFTSAAELFNAGYSIEPMLRQNYPDIALIRLGDGEAGSIAANRDALALPSASIDLAISIFGLHRCNDLPGALAQIRSALRPDGLFMAAIPGAGTLAELRSALLESETMLTGGAHMRVEPFAEIRQMGALLQRAGFALPVVDSSPLTLRYGDVPTLLRDLRANAAVGALAGNSAPLPKALPELLQQTYRGRFSDSDGRIRVSVNILYLTAWAPDPSQQKPLRPGSAQVSLAKVLGGGGHSNSISGAINGRSAGGME